MSNLNRNIKINYNNEINYRELENKDINCYSVYIIGEDERSNNLRKIYKEDIKNNIENAKVIFCPIPFSRDNVYITNTNIKIDDLIIEINDTQDRKIIVSSNIKSDVKNKLEENNIDVIDLQDYEEFTLKNAVATSEGAIKKAIEMTDRTINNSSILILGYGRIGKHLARILEGFGAKIYCEARKIKDIALIKSMGYNEVNLNDIDEILPNCDIIFNTIPHLILDKDRIDLLKEDVVLIDLASVPGGMDFEYIKQKNIKCSWYLSVPSKDSPYSAALYIKETVDRIIGEEEKWEKRLT